MKKVLIIGCGYVGSAAASALKALGNFITVTTRSPHKISDLTQFSDQVLLLDQPHDWSKSINEQDIILVCLAPDHSKTLIADPLQIYRTTYLNTANSLVTALKNNTSVQKVIYTSSTSVYNGCNSSTVNEEQKLSPITPQAQILLDSENIFLEISQQKQITIFRLGEIVGPSRMIETRLQQAKKPFPGDGHNVTNLIHLKDIVQAINFSISNNLQGIYNLCNDFHPTRKEFYLQMCEKLKLPPIKWDSSQKTIHGGKYLVSNTKIKQAGFVFSCPGYPEIA